MSDSWEFWIDRGGTFTDIVARRPDGTLVIRKLLSENPGRYEDAAVEGIRRLLDGEDNRPTESIRIAAVKMGTTVATNALLERKGEATLLAITKGFGDALRIGYQNRPAIFARHIRLPELIHGRTIEIEERVTAAGEVRHTLNEAAARAALEAAYRDGFRAVAIVLMHGYRYPEHERRVATLARAIGYTQISVSHEVSPLMKLVGRGDTTVVDAYLSPVLRHYVEQVARGLGQAPLLFMQSNGGLTEARRFQGRDAILSGPAGGIVGAVRTAEAAGFTRIIGFDMGGTSTDVSHYAGSLEHVFETQVAGVRMRAPMLHIHTVAAGGGSICHFDGGRFRVGPASAGAKPGPASYDRGGPLTVTDCNVMLGRIQPDYFPRVFGPAGDQPLNREAVRQSLRQVADDIAGATGQVKTLPEIAEGFLAIAVENMARAIKQISIQRGYDVSRYTLVCFGGAGGQHACRIADALGMTSIFIHPFAGVLSAFGMGLADLQTIRQEAVEAVLTPDLMPRLAAIADRLGAQAKTALAEQGAGTPRVSIRLQVKYQGTDTAITVENGDISAVKASFEASHQARYGFIMTEKPLVVETVTVEAAFAAGVSASVDAPGKADRQPAPVSVPMWIDGAERPVPLVERDALAHLPVGLPGPALIAEETATTIIEPGWRGRLDHRRNLILERVLARPERRAIGTSVDPVMLELFNSLFMSIAEQMGVVLQNTAYSVNIKERLDFSCAIFDAEGGLVANAPHIPVHLGSMGEGVAAIKDARGRDPRGMKPGDVYLLNAPYHGGTHLPDVTAIAPVFAPAFAETVPEAAPIFFVAARGHQADIGGTTPGSMPPESRTVAEEGVMIDNFLLVDAGQFREQALLELLAGAAYPARNPSQNLADLAAAVAACTKGIDELHGMVGQFGLDVVQAYMRHVQDNAEEAVRRVIDGLQDGAFTCPMDDGAEIHVAITIDRTARAAVIDFTGTSAQRPNNLNAPSAVCKAAVIYVFRTLVDDEIPLNGGCLKPLEIRIPEGSMLNPRYPAAVAGGNVETSQAITDALYGALGIMAAAQGTMNNFTFGNDRYQYYETICGGSGAGPDFDGTDAVHTHMTNSRLTDPEVLEWRYPVLIDSFSIRQGSGGAGRHKGGNGVIRRIRFLEGMTANILSNRRLTAPFGLDGGSEAQPGRNAVQRSDGTIQELPSTATIEMRPDDIFIIETPGGGGFGKA